MAIKLLPCPICHKIPKVKEDIDWVYYVKCCGAVVRGTWDYNDTIRDWNRKVRAYVPLKK